MSDMIICPKCDHEYEPSGSHDEDSGEQTCQKCGFEFIVKIDYDPSYSTSCVKHEYRDWKDYEMQPNGKAVRARFCKYCNHCQLPQD